MLGDEVMKRNDWLTGFLLLIIVVLSLALVDTRMSIQNNVRSIEVQASKEKIVFAGDSITDFYDLGQYYQYDNKILVNSGVSGYKTTNIIKKFKNLIEQHQADKLFLMIGTNDLGGGTDRDEVISNIKNIIEMTKSQSPDTKIYLESIYPVNLSKRSSTEKRNNEDIRYINIQLKKYCEENDITYLEVYSLLADSNGELKDEYTEDGLHLNNAGYDVITSYLKPYVEE